MRVYFPASWTRPFLEQYPEVLNQETDWSNDNRPPDAALACITLCIGAVAVLATNSGSATANPQNFIANILSLLLVAIFAAAYATATYGLFKLKNWARILSIVILAFTVLGYVSQILAQHQSATGIFMSQTEASLSYFLYLAPTALSVWAIVYLLRSDVKKAFQTQPQ